MTKQTGPDPTGGVHVVVSDAYPESVVITDEEIRADEAERVRSEALPIVPNQEPL